MRAIREVVRHVRERIAHKLFGIAFRIGGAAQFERSKEYYRAIAHASQHHQRGLRIDAAVDYVEKMQETELVAEFEKMQEDHEKWLLARIEKAHAADPLLKVPKDGP